MSIEKEENTNTNTEVDEVKQTNINTEVKADQEKEKAEEILEALLEKLDDSEGLGSDDNSVVFAALLELSDEEFSAAAPIFLEKMEEIYQTVDFREELIENVRQRKINLLELQDHYLELDNILQESFKDLSDEKKAFIKQFVAINVNTITDVLNDSGKIILIPTELENNEIKIPTYANKSDSGADIYAAEDIVIHPGETKIISTGIRVALPKGYEIQVRPKSGISSKSKLRIANTPGTIDSSYRGTIGIIVDNIDSPIKDITYDFDENGKPIITSILHGSDITIYKGQKIAQLVVAEVISGKFIQTEEINKKTDRGEGGFGSTGIY